MVQWDGMNSRDTDMESGAGWDFHSVSFPSHGTVGWDGQCIGMLVWRVVQVGILRICPFLPMVLWEGMDSRDYSWMFSIYTH